MIPKATQTRMPAMTTSAASAPRAAFGDSFSTQLELGRFSGIVASLHGAAL